MDSVKSVYLTERREFKTGTVSSSTERLRRLRRTFVKMEARQEVPTRPNDETTLGRRREGPIPTGVYRWTERKKEKTLICVRRSPVPNVGSGSQSTRSFYGPRTIHRLNVFVVIILVVNIL